MQGVAGTLRRGVRRLRGGVIGAVVIFGAMSSIPGAASAADETSQGIGRDTQLAVLGVTLAALVAAAFAVWRVVRGPRTDSLPFVPGLADVDLLEAGPPSANEPPIVGVFETVFLIVLLMYAVLDRAFAWVHVPGTPAFVGELTIALGVFAMLASRVPMVAAIRKSPALKALLAWMTWGLIFLVLQLPVFGLDAMRDSALWYYGIAAVLVVFLLLSDPARFGRWTDTYTKVLPFLLVWFPIAMVLDSIFGTSAPYVPDSEIPLLGHRFGNIAVLCGIAIGFIWLVDRERGRLSTLQRVLYTALAGIGILVAGFQNRGGMVSAVIGGFVMLMLLRRRRAELVLVIGGVVVALASIMVVADVRVPISSGREISAAQMMNNITSIINPESGGTRQAETTAWRLNLWSTVVDDVTSERPLTGWGPGPNLGVRYGVSSNKDVPLRNPHNSHVGILARMGWVGIGLWGILWIVWVFELLQLRAWLRFHGRSVEAGLVAWLLVSALMILLNAIFDPTLEGPQVGLWLWCIFGIGAALALVYSGFGSGVTNLATTDGRRRSTTSPPGGNGDRVT